MYYTGVDPFTKERVHVARNLGDRKLQRALMPFFKPENGFAVREALVQAGRQELIRSGCDCPIPAQLAKEAIEAPRRRANDADHYHTVANPAKGEKPGERDCPPRAIDWGGSRRTVKTGSTDGVATVPARDRSHRLIALSGASGGPRKSGGLPAVASRHRSKGPEQATLRPSGSPPGAGLAGQGRSASATRPAALL